jgi:hypothetical protein
MTISNTRIDDAITLLRDLSRTGPKEERTAYETAIRHLQDRRTGMGLVVAIRDRVVKAITALKAPATPASPASPKAAANDTQTVIKPLGWWRCKHADDWASSHFTVGELYECRHDTAGSPRIYPFQGSSWAPFWQEHNGKFCYERSTMDFEFVGRKRPAASIAA